MIQFKIFDLNSKTAEQDLAAIFTEFGGQINKDDIYAFSDKLGFLVNTDSDDMKSLKLTLHAFKRDLKSLKVQRAMAEKGYEMTKRRVASGKGKPDDVLDAKEKVNELIAEIDYNVEAIEKLENEITAQTN